MENHGFTAVPLLVVFVAVLIVLAGVAQGEKEFRAEITQLGIEAEKSAFIRHELENAVDAAVEYGVGKSVAEGKAGPSEIREEVVLEVNKVLGKFRESYGRGTLDVYITNVDHWAIFTIAHSNLIVVTATYTGGIYRDGFSGSEISVGGSKAVFRIPRGYTRVVVSAV